MRKLRILKDILVRTKAHRILITYVVFVLLAALAIVVFDPQVSRYGDALWYCYAVISTAGFGDVVVSTTVTKIISLLVTMYSTIVIAIVTGVVVNYYTEVIEIQKKETFTAFVDRLERLDTMTTEELREISDQVKRFKNNMKK